MKKRVGNKPRARVGFCSGRLQAGVLPAFVTAAGTGDPARVVILNEVKDLSWFCVAPSLPREAGVFSYFRSGCVSRRLPPGRLSAERAGDFAFVLDSVCGGFR